MTFNRERVVRAGRRTLLFASLVVIGETCTNLSEVPHDALTTSNAFHTPAEVLAGVAGVYANLRNIEWVGYLTVNELTTDAMIVPTRGSDWYDNGQWLDLHRQTWTPNSAGTLAFINGAWNDLFSGVAKANLMIDVISSSSATQASKDSSLAELRTLRAWYYYMLQDMFGGVPLVTSTALQQYPRSTRSQVFAFIEKELLASRTNLPDKWPAAFQGRVTKGAANAILASLYLNSGVFNKDAGVNANAYNSCTATVTGGATGCQAAIDAANAVINSGTYTLNANWFQNFAPDNKSSPENIFVIVHSAQQGLGGSFPMRTLHYNQLATGQGGPWNGFATLAETYNQFDPADDRSKMWLVGPQKSFETNAPTTDRQGNPLVFTVAIPDANQAGEGVGVRFNKFNPIPSPSLGAGQPNDFTFFRLAEMYLIKAEALNELGQTAAAMTELNRIHNLHNPTHPVTGNVRTAILQERLLELTGEGKRRTDLIRFGGFLKQWSTTMAHGKTDKSAETFRILFPIPAPQIASNPTLSQNPGY
ncbi:MAG: RagB/SusD protein [Gemmatimonadetes bacterium]|nr:RagB/SusD protein [Gemmatimonadota bacterium]